MSSLLHKLWYVHDVRRQRKLYARPVGNKSVQEVAAQAHENRMRSLIAQERSEPYGSVARTRISVMVGQGDIVVG